MEPWKGLRWELAAEQRGARTARPEADHPPTDPRGEPRFYRGASIVSVSFFTASAPRLATRGSRPSNVTRYKRGTSSSVTAVGKGFARSAAWQVAPMTAVTAALLGRKLRSGDDERSRGK